MARNKHKANIRGWAKAYDDILKKHAVGALRTDWFVYDSISHPAPAMRVRQVLRIRADHQNAYDARADLREHTLRTDLGYALSRSIDDVDGRVAYYGADYQIDNDEELPQGLRETRRALIERHIKLRTIARNLETEAMILRNLATHDVLIEPKNIAQASIVFKRIGGIVQSAVDSVKTLRRDTKKYEARLINYLGIGPKALTQFYAQWRA